jgi:hypothetical protein
MQALVYNGPGDKAWTTKPDPSIVDATDAIVQIDSSTICGTDLHILKGDVPEVRPGTILGVPQDDNGFVATDEYGWVLGVNDVYAAGDMTQFPLKQGGIATQQADAVASSIAADAGAAVRPQEFRPTLRGLLLTGLAPRFLRADATGAGSTIDTEPLWWPPAKIVGRYLAPFLAVHLGLAEDLPPELRTDAVPVDVELDRTDGRPIWSRV